MEVLWIIALVVVIAINWAIAKEFASIAIDKGYDESRYFWYCFLFGIVGYLMVIAMPDRGHANVSPTPPPTYNGEKGGTATAKISLTQIKCTRCNQWQPKSNSVCEQCGAKFTSFIQ